MKEFTCTFDGYTSLCDNLLTQMLYNINEFNKDTASWLR